MQFAARFACSSKQKVVEVMVFNLASRADCIWQAEFQILREVVVKILFAVDGSDYTVKAAQYIATHFQGHQEALELHLLHARLPIPHGHALEQAERLLGGNVDDRYYKEEAEAALATAEQILRKHNIPFKSTYKVGDIAEAINDYASTKKIDMIAMGSHGHGAFKNLLMGSVVSEVLALASIPVLVVR
jgi:nucleotide-binding universal stress UspA family protein